MPARQSIFPLWRPSSQKRKASAARRYRQLGARFDLEKPLTSILPQDAWTVVMNAGLFAHCILAYQVLLLAAFLLLSLSVSVSSLPPQPFGKMLYYVSMVGFITTVSRG